MCTVGCGVCTAGGGVCTAGCGGCIYMYICGVIVMLRRDHVIIIRSGATQL